MAKQTWIVSEDTKERLDKYLSSNTELSRTRVQQLADEGMIFVNGKVAKSSLKVVMKLAAMCLKIVQSIFFLRIFH